MRSPVKWCGGLSRIADRLWAIASTRPHLHRVEPYAGGLSFTLASEPHGYSEVVNDLHGPLMNFWATLASPPRFERLLRIVEGIPFSEVVWQTSDSVDPDRDVAAAKFFIHCRQSLMGGMKAFAPLSRNRVRRGMNEQVSAWLTAVEGLPQVHARLRRVAVLNRPAIACITSQDGPNTLFFCDPPFVHSTRRSDDYYEHEMGEEDHRQLLEVLSGIQGSAMLMGYRCDLYDRRLFDWCRTDFDMPNDMGGGSGRRTLSLWTNWNTTPSPVALSTGLAHG